MFESLLLFQKKGQQNKKELTETDGIKLTSTSSAKSESTNSIFLEAKNKMDMVKIRKILISEDTLDIEKIPYLKNAEILAAGDWAMVLNNLSLECLKVAFENKALCDLLTPRQLTHIIKDDKVKQKEALAHSHTLSAKEATKERGR
ncbi:MAG: hypothetical protein LEGION0398_MBIBDBAK_01071 [Legionellaceae bacterium]